MQAMTTRGSDVKGALAVLELFGAEYGVKALTLALQVTEQTVRNWRTGRTMPNERNFDEIRKLVDERRRVLLGRRDIRDRRTAVELAALDRASELLETDRDRAERAELVSRWTAQHDPFALVQSGTPREIEIPF